MHPKSSIDVEIPIIFLEGEKRESAAMTKDACILFPFNNPTDAFFLLVTIETTS